MNDLKIKRAGLVDQLRSLSANETMTDEQVADFDSVAAEVEKLDQQIQIVEEKRSKLNVINSVVLPSSKIEKEQPKMSNVLQYPLGDNESNAFKAFLVENNRSGFKQNGNEIVLPYATRAATDSTMNITTSADGGYLVPTGFSGLVATRKNDSMLADKLGVRRILGVGTTVNYPVESTNPEAFATTSEQADNHGTSFERNTVAVGSKAFTLVKKSRKIELTEELLQDSPVNIMEYVADRIAREIALTHNAALVAEVLANGTSFKTFAATGAIAAGELEAIVGNDTLGAYITDGSNPAWVMRNSTLWSIKSITGNPRLYAQDSNDLLGYKTFVSSSVASQAATAKSVLFGNWDYMGLREVPEVSMIVDPYSVDGLVILKYSFRLAYGILQAGALGYGVNAAS